MAVPVEPFNVPSRCNKAAPPIRPWVSLATGVTISLFYPTPDADIERVGSYTAATTTVEGKRLVFHVGLTKASLFASTGGVCSLNVNIDIFKLEKRHGPYICTYSHALASNLKMAIVLSINLGANVDRGLV